MMAAAAVLALAALASTPAFGQAKGGGRGGPQPPSGTTPKTADGKPDFSGLWQRPYTPDMTKDARDQKGMPELPFTEWGLQQWKGYDASKGDYTGACLPFGLVRSMNSPDPIQVMQNSKYMSFLYEQNTWFHVIPIDGRGHNKDLGPTWFGDSVGKWEGDTLVVDTVNFNGKTKLDTIG